MFFKLYQDIFNFEVSALFAAFLRITIISFPLVWTLFNLKNILFYSNPNKFFRSEYYLKFFNYEPYNFSLFKIFNSEYSQQIILSLFFIFGLFSILGFLTNISIFIFLIIYISIQNRIVIIEDSNGNAVIRVMLLSLLFTDCGSKYSIDRIIGISSNLDYINGWGIKLFQFYFSFIYLAASIEKLKDRFWRNGSALKNILLNPYWGRTCVTKFNIFRFAVCNKKLGFILCYLVIFLEFFIPPLLYFSSFRIFSIIFLIMFNIAISMFIRMGFLFPTPVMLLGILFFINSYFN